MKFLNGKEQVLDIQLTSYGKYKLSKGQFRPYFYSFFDDGVLYDSEHGGFNEAQKDTQNRIKNETPRLELQTSYVGVESSVREQISPTTSPASAMQIQEGLISSDAATSLNENFSGLTYELVKNQFKNQHVKPKGHRYFDEVKEFAATLHFYSPRAYKLMQPILSLPASSSISNWTSSVSCEPGKFHDVFQNLKYKINMDNDLKY